MGPRIAGMFLVLSLVAVALVATPGCQARPGSTESERLSRRFDQLNQTVKELSEQVAKVEKTKAEEQEAKWATREDLAKTNAELRAARAGLSSLDDTVANLNVLVREAASVTTRDVPRLKQELKLAKDGFDATVTGQREDREILAQISCRDTEGRRILAVRDQVRTRPQFRADLAYAVNEVRSVSQPTPDSRAVLQIENEMSTGQWMKVNGVLYWVLPHSKQDVEVSAGTVTTELVGYESPRYHTLGAPAYFQRVVIAPRET
jgi:outer membrane murein-binding lipoprotein Lpp